VIQSAADGIGQSVLAPDAALAGVGEEASLDEDESFFVSPAAEDEPTLASEGPSEALSDAFPLEPEASPP